VNVQSKLHYHLTFLLLILDVYLVFCVLSQSSSCFIERILNSVSVGNMKHEKLCSEFSLTLHFT